MISRAWFIDEMGLDEGVAGKMALYTTWDLSEMKNMRDVDIAKRYQDGVHAGLFTAVNVQHLVEMIYLEYKKPQRSEFVELCWFLTNKLNIGVNQAHCIAIYGLSKNNLLGVSDDIIEYNLQTAINKNWLETSDIAFLLSRLQTKYPNRLQHPNPYVVRGHVTRPAILFESRRACI
jgi:hypothetical protein